MDESKPFEELFDRLLKAHAVPAAEAPERIAASDGGAERIWRMSGMDICPACRAVRDAFSPEGGGGPTARFCPLCKAIEIYGSSGGLLFRRSEEERTREILDMVAGATILGPAGGDEEED